FVRTKLKHMRLGKVIDNTFRSGEKVELVEYDEKHMQFLYKDERYHFMDTETYEQVSMSADEVGDAREYLKENTEVDVLYIDGAPTAPVVHTVAAPIVRAAPATEPAVVADVAAPAGITVEAPMVGTFYRSSSPTAEPFVREGDVVKEGQILCIIEAMKLMNEIESKAAGRIVKILVENGQPVEYGQPLFLLEPQR